MFWRRQRPARPAIDAEDWRSAIEHLPLLEGLAAAELERLRSLAERFLQKKRLEPAQGAGVAMGMRLEIALQAALPILELGIDWYRGWHAVILYPDQFVPAHEVVDEDGLVWIDDAPKSGEAWDQGPVILSLTDAEAGRERDGYNVVLHELSHKLDLLDGAANGHPPLHAGMSDAGWARDLGAAYEDLCRRSEQPPPHPDAEPDTLGIDPYAGESPAEFFAVCSETFFELPDVLQAAYPAVYGQLRAFYRQDPLARLPSP